MYQDCSPAVSVANDRGSLAKKTKAMDIHVFSIRNKIEDHQVQLKLISAVEMVADMATKGLDQKKFVFFRDVMMNGYAYALTRASAARAHLLSLIP